MPWAISHSRRIRRRRAGGWDSRAAQSKCLCRRALPPFGTPRQQGDRAARCRRAAAPRSGPRLRQRPGPSSVSSVGSTVSRTRTLLNRRSVLCGSCHGSSPCSAQACSVVSADVKEWPQRVPARVASQPVTCCPIHGPGPTARSRPDRQACDRSTPWRNVPGPRRRGHGTEPRGLPLRARGCRLVHLNRCDGHVVVPKPGELLLDAGGNIG